MGPSKSSSEVGNFFGHGVNAIDQLFNGYGGGIPRFDVEYLCIATGGECHEGKDPFELHRCEDL
jgi:hypothetical protein